MFDTVCTLPLGEDIFCQSIHPSEPIIATGLATGHVSVYRLPSLAPSDSSSISIASETPTVTSISDGRGEIETIWRTRRHKASCRSLAFTLDGNHLFSAGAEGIVKFASSTTGQVSDKIAVPLDAEDGRIDMPTLLHVLSPQTLLLATDSAALHLYDLRVGSKAGNSGDTQGFTKRKPQQTHFPHADYVSSLSPLPPTEASTSGYSKQWVTTGGTTLAVTDLRRGVLVRSEDQEELLLSSVAVAGLSAKGTSTGEKVAVGGGNGVITLWERGQWDDQDERVVVDKGYDGVGESLDVLELLPEGVGPGGKVLACGLADGRVRFVKLGSNKVIGQLRHDDMEGVVGIGFDVEGRLITGGGANIKVWHEKVDEDNGAYVEEGKAPNARFPIDGDSDASGKEDDDSDDEQQPSKKQKVNKGGHLNGAAGSFSFAGLD